MIMIVGKVDKNTFICTDPERSLKSLLAETKRRVRLATNLFLKSIFDDSFIVI